MTRYGLLFAVAATRMVWALGCWSLKEQDCQLDTECVLLDDGSCVHSCITGDFAECIGSVAKEVDCEWNPISAACKQNRCLGLSQGSCASVDGCRYTIRCIPAPNRLLCSSIAPELCTEGCSWHPSEGECRLINTLELSTLCDEYSHDVGKCLSTPTGICDWDANTNKCDLGHCGLYESPGLCDRVAGCAWAEYQCERSTNFECNKIGVLRCSQYPGCGLDEDHTCTLCSSLSQQQCTSGRSQLCRWDDESGCHRPLDCNIITQVDECESHGCYWSLIEQTCVDAEESPHYQCKTVSDIDMCEQLTGCHWVGACTHIPISRCNFDRHECDWHPECHYSLAQDLCVVHDMCQQWNDECSCNEKGCRWLSHIGRCFYEPDIECGYFGEVFKNCTLPGFACVGEPEDSCTSTTRTGPEQCQWNTQQGECVPTGLSCKRLSLRMGCSGTTCDGVNPKYLEGDMYLPHNENAFITGASLAIILSLNPSLLYADTKTPLFCNGVDCHICKPGYIPSLTARVVCHHQDETAWVTGYCVERPPIKPSPCIGLEPDECRKDPSQCITEVADDNVTYCADNHCVGHSKSRCINDCQWVSWRSLCVPTSDHKVCDSCTASFCKPVGHGVCVVDPNHCENHYQLTCMSTSPCDWSLTEGKCVLFGCMYHSTEQRCNAVPNCEWNWESYGCERVTNNLCSAYGNIECIDSSSLHCGYHPTSRECKDCQLLEKTDCEMTHSCQWNRFSHICYKVIPCGSVVSVEQCELQDLCIWETDGCVAIKDSLNYNKCDSWSENSCGTTVDPSCYFDRRSSVCHQKDTNCHTLTADHCNWYSHCHYTDSCTFTDQPINAIGCIGDDASCQFCETSLQSACQGQFCEGVQPGYLQGSLHETIIPQFTWTSDRHILRMGHTNGTTNICIGNCPLCIPGFIPANVSCINIDDYKLSSDLCIKDERFTTNRGNCQDYDDADKCNQPYCEWNVTTSECVVDRCSIGYSDSQSCSQLQECYWSTTLSQCITFQSHKRCTIAPNSSFCILSADGHDPRSKDVFVVCTILATFQSCFQHSYCMFTSKGCIPNECFFYKERNCRESKSCTWDDVDGCRWNWDTVSCSDVGYPCLDSCGIHLRSGLCVNCSYLNKEYCDETSNCRWSGNQCIVGQDTCTRNGEPVQCGHVHGCSEYDNLEETCKIRGCLWQQNSHRCGAPGQFLCDAKNKETCDGQPACLWNTPSCHLDTITICPDTPDGTCPCSYINLSSQQFVNPDLKGSDILFKNDIYTGIDLFKVFYSPMTVLSGNTGGLQCVDCSPCLDGYSLGVGTAGVVCDALTGFASVMGELCVPTPNDCSSIECPSSTECVDLDGIVNEQYNCVNTSCSLPSLIQCHSQNAYCDHESGSDTCITIGTQCPTCPSTPCSISHQYNSNGCMLYECPDCNSDCGEECLIKARQERQNINQNPCPVPNCPKAPMGCEYVLSSKTGAHGCPLFPCGVLSCTTCSADDQIFCRSVLSENHLCAITNTAIGIPVYSDGSYAPTCVSLPPLLRCPQVDCTAPIGCLFDYSSDLLSDVDINGCSLYPCGFLKCIPFECPPADIDKCCSDITDCKDCFYSQELGRSECVPRQCTSQVHCEDGCDGGAPVSPEKCGCGFRTCTGYYLCERTGCSFGTTCFAVTSNGIKSAQCLSVDINHEVHLCDQLACPPGTGCSSEGGCVSLPFVNCGSSCDDNEYCQSVRDAGSFGTSWSCVVSPLSQPGTPFCDIDSCACNRKPCLQGETCYIYSSISGLGQYTCKLSTEVAAPCGPVICGDNKKCRVTEGGLTSCISDPLPSYCQGVMCPQETRCVDDVSRCGPNYCSPPCSLDQKCVVTLSSLQPVCLPKSNCPPDWSWLRDIPNLCMVGNSSQCPDGYYCPQSSSTDLQGYIPEHCLCDPVTGRAGLCSDTYHPRYRKCLPNKWKCTSAFPSPIESSWCCTERGIGCDEYFCSPITAHDDPDNWSFDKRSWCCAKTSLSIGCTTGYDCAAPTFWSYAKQMYCGDLGFGLPKPSVDCFSADLTSWSQSDADWCCSNTQVCPSDVSEFDCTTTDTWSLVKSEYCCQRLGIGCKHQKLVPCSSSVETNCFDEVDCEMSANWDWCCENLGKKCPGEANCEQQIRSSLRPDDRCCDIYGLGCRYKCPTDPHLRRSLLPDQSSYCCDTKGVCSPSQIASLVATETNLENAHPFIRRFTLSVMVPSIAQRDALTSPKRFIRKLLHSIASGMRSLTGSNTTSVVGVKSFKIEGSDTITSVSSDWGVDPLTGRYLGNLDNEAPSSFERLVDVKSGSSQAVVGVTATMFIHSDNKIDQDEADDAFGKVDTTSTAAGEGYVIELKHDTAVDILSPTEGPSTMIPTAVPLVPTPKPVSTAAPHSPTPHPGTISPTESSGDDFPLLIVVLGGAGGLILVIVIVYCCRSRRRSAESEDTRDFDAAQPAAGDFPSPRGQDRINQGKAYVPANFPAQSGRDQVADVIEMCEQPVDGQQNPPQQSPPVTPPIIID
eukprot:TRINITY_DN4554_c0_g1_i1.p1 TRINITY_DN4554_c0_g1~~TRINITY_DN4554_c0_g1_i1.p1  ORF type:complete len:2502 (+),score=260.99 TRINITY_DN4554_c0_g1_i1:1462-8967(+)